MADCHLNQVIYKSVTDQGHPFRTLDFMRAFEYNGNKCLDEIHPDLIVIAGDTYENFDPNNEVRSFLNEWLSKFNKAGIPVIIMVGNHDICKRHYPLQPLHKLDLPKIKIIERPKIMKFKGHRLLLFPYSLDVEQEKVTIKEDFQAFVAKAHEEMEKEELPTFFFGHFGVKGAAMNAYVDESALFGEDDEDGTNTNTTTTEPVYKDFINTNPEDIGLKDLDDIGAEYVFLGDYHRHQVLRTKKCKAMYCGSIEKTDMSERDQGKGFLVYDSEADEDPEMGRCRFVTYPNCRPMLELRGSFADMKAEFAKIDNSKYQGAIVKLAFIGTRDENVTFCTYADEFERELVDKLKAVYIIRTTKTVDKKKEEEASKIEEKIMERGYVRNEDIIEIVEEIIEEQVPDDDEEELKLTKELARWFWDRRTGVEEDVEDNDEEN